MKAVLPHFMALWTLAATTAAPAPLIHPPVRLAEMLYARLSVRLTLASGGIGRYGTVWGVWHWAQLTPGLGYFQPDFQCAEYVMRSLRAAGYAIATPSADAPGWVDMVNVDRALSYLQSRGIARPAPLSALQVGDVVLFHYLRNGPDNWSHVALVQAVHPLRLSAHDRNRWNAPFSSYPPYEAVMGLRTLANPHPPSGLVPLGATTWGEVALRDPPLRVRPAGAAGRRLYLGDLVWITGAARAPGSLTGWLSVRSGPLSGWINGDAVTRLTQPPPALPAPVTLLGLGRPRVSDVPVAVRGAWGTRLYVAADGCPLPVWVGSGCTAPYVALRQVRFPTWTVVARHNLALSLSPDPASVTVERLAANSAVPAERIGSYAALFGPGGPAASRSVLYAPAKLFAWHRGGVYLFLQAVRAGALQVPAATAASVWGSRLVSLSASFPLTPAGLNCPVWHPGSPALPPPSAAAPACLYVPQGG